MSHVLRTGLIGALLVLLLAPFAGARAATAPAPAAPPSVGVVDLDQVEKDYKGYQAAKDHLQAFSDEREKSFTTLQAGLGLSKDDFDDYQSRVSGSVKTDPDRIKTLTELAKKNSDTYQALTAKDKDKLTADEKTQLETLDKNIKTVTAIIHDQGQKLSQQIQDEYSRYSKTLNKLVNDGIGDVAKKQKLAVVLSKSVQTRDGEAILVLWGGTDVTTDVLKLLNDNFKPALLEEKPAAK